MPEKIETGIQKTIEQRVTDGLGYRGTQIAHVYYKFIKDDEDKRLQLGFAEIDWLTGQASEEAVNLFNDYKDRVFKAACFVQLRELQRALKALIEPEPPALPIARDFYFPKISELYPSFYRDLLIEKVF